jgi:hypothetical protein
MNRKTFLPNSMTQGIIFLIIAVTLTIIGFSQTLIYKTPPRVATTLWFPWALIAKRITGNDLVMLTAALGQFPMFAGAVMVVSRYWSLKNTASTLVAAYLTALAIAFAFQMNLTGQP